MLSSAFLFAGATPHKALRVFKCVGIVLDKQISLLAILKERLVVAGDGRCDSLGHSAKIGS